MSDDTFDEFWDGWPYGAIEGRGYTPEQTKAIVQGGELKRTGPATYSFSVRLPPEETVNITIKSKPMSVPSWWRV